MGGSVSAKMNVPGGRWGLLKNEQGRTMEGGGVKTRESLANVLFECPLLGIHSNFDNIFYDYIKKPFIRTYSDQEEREK